MKRFIGLVVSFLLLTGVTVAGQPDRQKKHKGAKADAPIEANRNNGTSVDVRVVFGAHDIQLVRSHYSQQYSNLPPGLQKKLARGGSLPPGWQKKMQPFPVGLERSLLPLPAGYSRGVIDAHAVIYNSSGLIVDVAVLF